MKILFASNHNPNFLNTNAYREKAIKELGHELVFFDDRDFIIPGRIRQKVGFLREWDLKRLNRNMLSVAGKEKPDLCLMVGGHRVFAETLLEMRSMGIKVVLWTTDPPRGFTYIIKTAPCYDHIFCAGTEAVEIFRREGIEGAFWLPFGCDPDYHKKAYLDDGEVEKYKKDIVFVGAFYPNRAKIFETISDTDIAVWGPNWNRLDSDSPLKGKAINAKLNYTEWVKIYSAAKIVIVVHYQDGQTPCNQASPKLFEALACGSFVMADNQKDARTLFEDKKHLVFFRNENDLRGEIAYYLEHPEERERIALEGYREVLMKHTYKHRIERILEMIRQ